MIASQTDAGDRRWRRLPMPRASSRAKNGLPCAIPTIRASTPALGSTGAPASTSATTSSWSSGPRSIPSTGRPGRAPSTPRVRAGGAASGRKARTPRNGSPPPAPGEVPARLDRRLVGQVRVVDDQQHAGAVPARRDQPAHGPDHHVPGQPTLGRRAGAASAVSSASIERAGRSSVSSRARSWPSSCSTAATSDA